MKKLLNKFIPWNIRAIFMLLFNSKNIENAFSLVNSEFDKVGKTTKNKKTQESLDNLSIALGELDLSLDRVIYIDVKDL